MEKYNFSIDLDIPVLNLSAGQKQKVEIIRCLIRSPEVLIMDEPTSVLTEQETDDFLLHFLFAGGSGTTKSQNPPRRAPHAEKAEFTRNYKSCCANLRRAPKTWIRHGLQAFLHFRTHRNSRRAPRAENP